MYSLWNSLIPFPGTCRSCLFFMKKNLTEIRSREHLPVFMAGVKVGGFHMGAQAIPATNSLSGLGEALLVPGSSGSLG